MSFLLGVIGIGAVVVVSMLVYRSSRHRRAPLVRAFVTRIGFPLTGSVLALIDRQIWARFVGSCVGALVALLGAAVLVVSRPDLVLTGTAGFASAGVLTAVASLGATVAVLRKFTVSSPGVPRINHAVTPTLRDYVHQGWIWSAVLAAGSAAILTAGILLGGHPPATEIGLPLGGVVGLTVAAILGVPAAALLGRLIRALPQPAADELELQWDDALRASDLRDLWFASISLSAAALVVAYSWLFGATSTAPYIGVLIGYAPLVLWGLRASGHAPRRLWGQRPVQTLGG